MSLNRIVAVLTPLVFAPLAGVTATWAAKNLPGVALPQEKIEEIFIAGALIALAPALQWLHGWQKYEQRQHETLTRAATGFGIVPMPDTGMPPLDEYDDVPVGAYDYPDAGDDLEDYDE